MTVRVAISLLAGRGASILITPRSNPAGEPNPNPPAAPFNLLPGDEPHEFVVDDPEGFTVSELIGDALDLERTRRSSADRRKREDAERQHDEAGDGKVKPPSAPGREPLGQDPAFNSEHQPGAEEVKHDEVVANGDEEPSRDGGEHPEGEPA